MVWRIQAQVGFSLFRHVFNSVFQENLRIYLPERVLPISAMPPTDLITLFDQETQAIEKLLRPGSRRRTEAEAKLRSLAIVEKSINGEKVQPSVGELRKLASEIAARKKAWNEIFPGVATVTLTTTGYGPSIDLRITKTGVPIQLVKEGASGGTVVAIKRVDDLGFYNLGRDQIAEKVGLSGPRTTAIIRFLKLQDDQECYKQVTIGKAKFDRYSQKAIGKIQEALKKHGMEIIWKSHGIRSRTVQRKTE